MSSLLAYVDLTSDVQTNLASIPLTLIAYAIACRSRIALRDSTSVPLGGTLPTSSSSASANTFTTDVLIHLTLAFAFWPTRVSTIACYQLLFHFGLVACDNIQCNADAFLPWIWLLSPQGLRVTLNLQSVPAARIPSTSPFPASANLDMSDEPIDMTLACTASLRSSTSARTSIRQLACDFCLSLFSIFGCPFQCLVLPFGL